MLEESLEQAEKKGPDLKGMWPKSLTQEGLLYVTTRLDVLPVLIIPV